MQWSPRVTVATLIEMDHKFLMVHELSDGNAVYNQPAGHLEADESLLDAAIRETREETGWIVEPTHLLGVSLYTSPLNGLTYLRTSIIARPLHRLADPKLDTDIIEAVWLTYEQLLEKNKQLRSPLVLRDVEQYRRGVKHPLDILYQHGHPK
jgi:8-oxo-dGTP pyrophosphatase MutT (NUDIX family)